MTFFFDNNFSPKLVLMLRALDVSAIHLREEFAPDTDDTEWLSQLADRDWILVTCDRQIRRRSAERRALERNRCDAVIDASRLAVAI